MARPRSDIKPRIVTAARARFLAQGVDGASLRAIARDAGTNIGMIVYYFPTKDDLFLSVVEEAYAGIVDDMAHLLGAAGPALPRLRQAFCRLGSASDLEIEVIRLMAREALISSARLRRLLARFMHGHIPLVMATISDGIRNGELDGTIPAPLILLAVVGLGPLPQLVRRAARALPLFASLPDADHLADLSIGLLTRTVGAAKTPAKPRKSDRARRDGSRTLRRSR
jgi:AcrR family transcriptional regulator